MKLIMHYRVYDDSNSLIIRTELHNKDSEIIMSIPFEENTLGYPTCTFNLDQAIKFKNSLNKMIREMKRKDKENETIQS